jgi:hypothetical protein
LDVAGSSQRKSIRSSATAGLAGDAQPDVLADAALAFRGREADTLNLGATTFTTSWSHSPTVWKAPSSISSWMAHQTLTGPMRL